MLNEQLRGDGIRMSRWRILLWSIAAAIALSILCVGVYSYVQSRASARREQSYQSTLQAFRKTISPGMTRGTVESLLAQMGSRYSHVWGYNSSWADQILIGQEPPPWYCNSWDVYVVLQFNERHQLNPPPEKSDVLQGISLIKRGGSCLWGSRETQFTAAPGKTPAKARSILRRGGRSRVAFGDSAADG